MSAINGIAKKSDDTPVDYVSIFDWDNGKCLIQVVPNILGEWEYVFYRSGSVGITYVADGYQSITHGPYELVSDNEIPGDTILHYTFDGDVQDSSINELHGVMSGYTNFVAGRVPGTMALQFTSGIVSTPEVLPINSDKLTISFWIKTRQTALGMIYELSYNLDRTHEGVYLYHQSSVLNSFNRTRRPQSLLNTCTTAISTNATWQHFVIQVDRSAGLTNAQKIFKDNVSVGSLPGDQLVTGEFINDILHIGQRPGGSFSLNADLQHFRVYNRILSTDEITLLFQE